MDDNGRGALFRLLLGLAVAATLAAADDESAVMSKFLTGFSSAPQGWSSRTNHCQWTGVRCDSSSHVTSIDLASMSLSGTLPSDLTPLSRLKSISLQRNSLSGSIPSFANLESLEEIFLDNNNFTDVPSGVFKGLTSLQSLSIGNNPNLQPWTIPEDLKQSSSLVELYVSGANVVGSMPDFFDSLPSLQRVRLSYNSLNGSLPASLGGSSIQTLWLNNQAQGLSGTLDVLATMTQLTQAWLHKNQFTGPIPDLSKCEGLFDLQLRDNVLTGVVPASLTSLPNIQNISLDSNKFQGPIPDNSRNIKLTYQSENNFCKTTPGPCDPQVTTLLEVAGALGYPTSLADAWAGNNACQGWGFVTCQNNKVTSVTLSKQKLVGSISPSFGNLTSLRSLLLNDNGLTGSIPDSLAKLPNLEVLDVSNNNLSGLVPTFPSKVKLITSGNPLLGKELKSGGKAGGSGSALGSSISGGAIAGIVISVLVFILAVSFFVFRCFHSKLRCWKLRRVTSSSDETQPVKRPSPNQGNMRNNNDFPIIDNGNVMVSIHALRQVTDNFSPSNIIGRGGFGTVYRGVFEDGFEIAVKRMELAAMNGKGMNEFEAEISVLTQVRHRHLVALLGFCINGNERLLVYEYMPRGTLSQHLFQWQENKVPPLSWNQRLTIAIDVARGVEYLHSLAQQSFIHRDLKPSNILLGDDMRAKVADFGLVRNAPDGKYSVETRLAGTFGYLAPEYAATGKVTRKVDVFAFGVILMEMITGRKALDDTVSDERSHLVTWFRKILIAKEDLSNVIDRTIVLDDDTMESITKVAELCGHCTAREPQQRPDMGHVVNVLSPLIEQWRPESRYGFDDDGLGGSTDLSLNMSLPQALQKWQSEGTSTMYGGGSTMTRSSYGQNQTRSSYGENQTGSSYGENQTNDSSIPSKPSALGDSLNSTNCR